MQRFTGNNTKFRYRAGIWSIFFFLSCTSMCYVVMVNANGVSFNAGPFGWGAKSGCGGGR